MRNKTKYRIKADNDNYRLYCQYYFYPRCCSSNCGEIKCSLVIHIDSFKKLNDNPLKWSSLHLQSNIESLRTLAKLILEDRITL